MFYHVFEERSNDIEITKRYFNIIAILGFCQSFNNISDIILSMYGLSEKNRHIPLLIGNVHQASLGISLKT